MAKAGKDSARRHFHELLQDEQGLTTVEYIIILCLIAVVGFAIWKKFGETVKSRVGGADRVIGELPTESSPGGGP